MYTTDCLLEMEKFAQELLKITKTLDQQVKCSQSSSQIHSNLLSITWNSNSTQEIFVLKDMCYKQSHFLNCEQKQKHKFKFFPVKTKTNSTSLSQTSQSRFQVPISQLRESMHLLILCNVLIHLDQSARFVGRRR